MDYFRLAMYYAFIDVNVSPYACGMETVPNENILIEEIGKINRTLCPIIDKIGIPFVQQTAFGTVWNGKSCAVLFFWNPVERLYLELPENWSVKTVFSVDGSTPEVEGNIIKNISHKSMIFISEK
ncbi:MAG: hypothetical protein A2020_03540 [Lentisphaerae bacterium GWF2_45_14]|nr:MAG: hypothetical protein A2020_03540 [Lentisphaerae bacterium GWF2_45_14]